jgi:hypothetical protein
MKYTQYLRASLGALLLSASLPIVYGSLTRRVTATPTVTPSPSINLGVTDPLEAAMERTKKQQYAEAIAILKTGEQHYRQRGDEVQAYASQILAIKLQEKLHDQGKPGGVARAERAEIIGMCLDTEDCHYMLEWYAPSETTKKYGGILILSKQVGRYTNAQGQSSLIEGLMDIKVVPALSASENILSNCRDKSQETVAVGMLGITAIPENIASSPAVLPVRKAWFANLGWGKLQELSATSTVCELHLP